MSRPEPTSHAEMHQRYIESRRRLGMDKPKQTPRVLPALPRDDLRPTEIDALADALLQRIREDDDDLSRLPRPLMLSDIVAVVARRHGVSPSEIRSERRTSPVVRARQRAVWLCKRMTLRSLPAIGRAVGRDHTTVLHSLRAVDAELARDPALGGELAAIEAELRSRFGPPSDHPATTRLFPVWASGMADNAAARSAERPRW